MIDLGIITDCGDLTEEGRELYEAYRFQKDREDFYKEAVQKLVDEKKKESVTQ